MLNFPAGIFNLFSYFSVQKNDTGMKAADFPGISVHYKNSGKGFNLTMHEEQPQPNSPDQELQPSSLDQELQPSSLDQELQPNSVLQEPQQEDSGPMPSNNFL